MLDRLVGQIALTVTRSLVPGWRREQQLVLVCRKLGSGQRVPLSAAACTELEAVCASVDSDTAAQIRQAEVRATVPTVGSPNRREECLVLADGERLPVAGRPAVWYSVEPGEPYLADDVVIYPDALATRRVPRD